MATKSISKQQKDSENQELVGRCAHHWLIDPPDGPVSNGTCKKCGETREFVNWGRVTEPQ